MGERMVFYMNYAWAHDWEMHMKVLGCCKHFSLDLDHGYTNVDICKDSSSCFPKIYILQE